MPPKKSGEPKARAKLSTAKRAEATRKSRITRCKKKCDDSGGEAKAKRSYAPGKRQEAAERAKVNLAPWRNFMGQYRRNYELDHNDDGRSYKELQQLASKEWAKMTPSKKAEYADK